MNDVRQVPLLDRDKTPHSTIGSEREQAMEECEQRGRHSSLANVNYRKILDR